MIHVDTLATLLRVLGRGAASASPVAPQPIPRIPPIAETSDDRALSPGGGEGPGADSHPAPTRPGMAGSAVGPRPMALATPRDAVPQPSAPGPRDIALSRGGALLLDALKLADDASGPVVRAPGALLSSPPLDAAVLARALEHAIARSGLFYESHLARWAAHDYPLHELLQEPQAAWKDAPTSSLVDADSDLAAGPGEPMRRDEAPLLVRQQLEANEAHRLALSGTLWPGQSALIEFQEAGHTRDHGSGGDEPHVERAWAVRVAMTLPSLGEVSAVIALRGDNVDCRITADSRDAERRLAEGHAELDAAIRRRALRLARWETRHE